MPLVDEVIIECNEDFDKGLVKFVKVKEAYIFYNLTMDNGYYTITSKTCSKTSQIGEGQITSSSNSPKSSITFTPIGEGEFTLIFYLGNKKEKVILSHYPSLIKSIVKDIKKALCSCGCGCPENDCIPIEAKNCLTYQNIFGDLSLLVNIYKTIEKCKSKNIIRDFIAYAIDYYKCDLFQLFCAKELKTKLEGKANYSDKMFRKVIAINYLGLYFYELMISSPIEENIDYVRKKFRYKTIKDCILKAGIDIVDMETLYSILTYCESTEPPVCHYGCFQPVLSPQEFNYLFTTGQIVTGIHHVSSIINSCTTDEYLIDRLLYTDNEFKVKVKNDTGVNPLLVVAGDVVNMNVIFEGTKTEPTIIRVPYKLDGVLINTYIIEFKDPVNPNRPPVITDVLKVIPNRQNYTFTVSDFENNFTDPDGDIMAKIKLVGDTSRFRLAGVPYISNTPIDRNNITDLVYMALDTDNEYTLIVNWQAWDSHGLPSN